MSTEPIKTRSRSKKVEVPAVPEVTEVVTKVKKERVKKERSPEEIEATKERMAKIRAMRKPKATA